MLISDNEYFFEPKEIILHPLNTKTITNGKRRS